MIYVRDSVGLAPALPIHFTIQQVKTLALICCTKGQCTTLWTKGQHDILHIMRKHESRGSQNDLTISVRQAGVAAHRTVTLERDRPLDRHASRDRNVKF